MSFKKLFARTQRFLKGSMRAPRRCPGNARSFRPQLEHLEERRVLSADFNFGVGVGSSLRDLGQAVATDNAGNVYVTGSFRGTVDADPGAGTTNLVSKGGEDVFLAKYSITGDLVWAKQFGAGQDAGNGIALEPGLDANSNVYLTGSFQGSVDFDPNAGVTKLSGAGSRDVFVMKLTSAGALVWARGMGGADTDVGNAIAVDGSGNVYTTGSFQTLTKAADFDPGAGTFKLVSIGRKDAFISKLDSAGTFVWAKRIGGFDNESVVGNGIAVNADGAVFTVGSFSGVSDIANVDFDPGTARVNLATTSRLENGYLLKLNSQGNFDSVKNLGGKGADRATAVALDKDGNVFVTGFFTGTDFDAGGTTNLKSKGDADVFVLKYDSAGHLTWAQAMGGTGTDQANGIVVDAAGNVYTTGFFNGSAAFDPASSTNNLTSAGGKDIFLSKLDKDGKFVFAKKIGGSGDEDIAHAMAIDSFGDIAIAGEFSGTVDFDPDSGTTELTSTGGQDLFVLQLQNAPPVANNDTATTAEDTPKTINVLSNDSDFVASTVKVTTDPAHGTTTVNTDGSIVYTPNPDFNGTDTFVYTVKDDTGATDTATVTVTVTPVNDPPKVTDDFAITNKNTAVTISVLDNDSDVDGTINTTSVTIFSTPLHGTATVNPDGTIKYTPDTDFTGVETFQYQVKDNSGSPSTASVRVDVIAP